MTSESFQYVVRIRDAISLVTLDRQGCLIMPDFVRRFGVENPDGTFTLSSSRQSIITSLLSAGCVVTAVFSAAMIRTHAIPFQHLRVRNFDQCFLGFPDYISYSGALGQTLTSDRYGRRGSILIWAAIFTVGVAVQTGTTTSIVQLTVGRFIAGLGVGALSGTYFCGEPGLCASWLPSYCAAIQRRNCTKTHPGDYACAVSAADNFWVRDWTLITRERTYSDCQLFQYSTELYH